MPSGRGMAASLAAGVSVAALRRAGAPDQQDRAGLAAEIARVAADIVAGDAAPLVPAREVPTATADTGPEPADPFQPPDHENPAAALAEMMSPGRFHRMLMHGLTETEIEHCRALFPPPDAAE